MLGLGIESMHHPLTRPKNEALSDSAPVTAVTSFESRHVGTLPRSLTSAHAVHSSPEVSGRAQSD